MDWIIEYNRRQYNINVHSIQTFPSNNCFLCPLCLKISNECEKAINWLEFALKSDPNININFDLYVVFDWSHISRSEVNCLTAISQ